MRHHLYLRLAVGNIKNNRRFYLPFLFTAALTVVCFFIMSSIGVNQTLPGGNTVQIVMHMGVIIVGLFSVIFLYYTNSFLIKRRKKELGLYNILGLEKRHIAAVLTLETVLSALLSIGSGLIIGVLLDRLMFLVLRNLLAFDVTMTYAFHWQSVTWTVIVFAAIFLLLLLANLVQVGRAKPIELLRGGEVGEKEPRVKWPLVVIGLLALGSGYYIAVTTESVIAALGLFFVAVVLVIIGTYCLFLAGSIAVLKVMKRNKGYYYKVRHFVSVSGMLYRMKQNAVGLANICILSTMVLVTVSTTVSLYGGVTDILERRFPYDLEAHFYNAAEPVKEYVRTALNEEVEAAGLEVTQLVDYDSLSVALLMDGNRLVPRDDKLLADTAVATSQGAYIQFFTPEGYAAVTGYQVGELGEHEVAAYVQDGTLPETFNLMGEDYTVKEWITTAPADSELSGYLGNTFYIVVRDDVVLERIYQAQLAADGESYYASSMDWEFSVNLSGTEAQKAALADRFQARFETDQLTLNDGSSYPIEWVSTVRQDNISDAYSLYGSFLFLGILLGLLFLMATVLIIYYKQIIEGYDDRARFQIMRQGGMDKKLISSSVRSQVLTMFLLPLGMAAVHLCFAFPLLTRVLKALMLDNVSVFFWCTLITFAAFVVVYVLVYAITARVYYRTVSLQERR